MLVNRNAKKNKSNITHPGFILFLLYLLVPGLAFSEGPTGLSITGLPSVSYGSDEGFQYGGQLFLFQYGDGAIKPYKWSMELTLVQTTKHKQDYSLFFDHPDIFGPDSRLNVKITYQRYIFDDFYGIGNNTDFISDYSDDGSSRFIDKDYYFYKRKYFAMQSNIQFPLWKDGLKGLAGVGIFHTSVGEYGYNTLFPQTPVYGRDGGYTNYIQAGIVYDRRDDEAVTTKGFWTDLLLERSGKMIGSDYNYYRITFTDRRYFSLHPRVVYAQRFIYETMPGDPPFYEMGIFSGSFKRREGFGGAYSMRGIPRLMYMGTDKLLANFELRFKVHHNVIMNQDLTYYIQPFLDCGRVWLDEDQKIFDNLHFSKGVGFHIRWNKDFVASLDMGTSRFITLGIYTNFGNLF